MVNFIDYFFFKITQILIHLKKDEGGAKWSAFLYTGLYVTATIVGILCLLGLLYDNYISNLLKQSPLAFNMIAGVLIPLLLSIRYYYYTSVAIIESSYNTMRKDKRRVLDMLIYTVMIIVPVLSFVLFRLYVIGSVLCSA